VTLLHRRLFTIYVLLSKVSCIVVKNDYSKRLFDDKIVVVVVYVYRSQLFENMERKMKTVSSQSVSRYYRHRFVGYSARKNDRYKSFVHRGEGHKISFVPGSLRVRYDGTC